MSLEQNSKGLYYKYGGNNAPKHCLRTVHDPETQKNSFIQLSQQTALGGGFDKSPITKQKLLLLAT